MGMTSFYTGSLRYDHTGRKRKNHCANRVRKKTPPISTKPRKPSQSELDRLQASKEFKEKYPSMMEQQMNLCSIPVIESWLVLLPCISLMLCLYSRMIRSTLKI